MIPLLDLDGVLVDLEKRIYGHYNIVPKIGEWEDNIGKTDGEILKEVESFEFWRDLPKLPWADELIDFIASQTDNWGFLSTPTGNPDCWAGKQAWMQINYPKHAKRLILAREKFRLASHRHVLIDDRKKNLDSFKKAGGEIIPFPSRNGHYPWTEQEMTDPVSVVRKQFLKIETTRISKH